MDSKKESVRRAYNEGQKDGSKGKSGMAIGWNSATQPGREERRAYNKGVDHGRDNRPKKR